MMNRRLWNDDMGCRNDNSGHSNGKVIEAEY